MPLIIPRFHQVEGLYVDRNVTVGDLKGTVEFVFKELMGPETRIRFRPHAISANTEPSFEIDFSSPLTRKNGQGMARNRRLRHGASAGFRERGLMTPKSGAAGVWLRHRARGDDSLRHQHIGAVLRE